MSYQVTVKVKEDLSIPLPESLLRKYHIERGSELILIDEEASISLVIPRKRGERFAKALQAVRESVKAAGGISDAEIDEAVKRVREKQ